MNPISLPSLYTREFENNFPHSLSPCLLVYIKKFFLSYLSYVFILKKVLSEYGDCFECDENGEFWNIEFIELFFDDELEDDDDEDAVDDVVLLWDENDVVFEASAAFRRYRSCLYLNMTNDVDRSSNFTTVLTSVKTKLNFTILWNNTNVTRRPWTSLTGVIV